MTLTEEQREAIRVISKLPMAIGCQLCHPYEDLRRKPRTLVLG